MRSPAVLCSAASAVLHAEGKYRTGDLGGTATCSAYTDAIIDELDD
jgi:isocitrate/isopropylmalate dehydrogenase